MFFVIGSRNSSNSVRLVEVAKKSGCENSQLIHSESTIPYDQIEKCNTIGISSGASAPEILVENLNNLKKDKCFILISHKKKPLKYCKAIYTFENNQIKKINQNV